ncbi:hypothetical protein K438DRAFT_998712 [Mycena galopus ATCC 62051]|nr:hypothetical protein K438DRAFT_998712 [Mycena galopus ATCC 62051]
MVSKSVNEKLGLQDLVEDVLIFILVECDIVDVIAVSETSKYFHCLAFANTLWHSFVTKLVRRGFIARRPDDGSLADLSTAQLVDLVKRTLRGPKAWTNAHSAPHSSAPQTAVRRAANLFTKFVRKPKPPVQRPLASASLIESTRIVLHPTTISMDPTWSFYWPNQTKLLPGGNFVLFKDQTCLRCWSVVEDRLFWKHTPSMDDALVLDFEVGLEDDLAIIATYQRNWFQLDRSFVEIHTLNLRTGVSELQLVSRVLTALDLDPFTSFTYIESVVCGDIVAVRSENEMLLINWRTRSRVAISAHISQIGLAPGHLVLVLTGVASEHQLATSNCQLAISPFASFTFWEPNDSLEEPSTRIAVADLPLLSDTITLIGQPYLTRQRSMWVYENPLQRNRFKIWLHAWVDGHPALCSYQFVTHGTGLSWRFLASTPLPEPINPRHVSLSGYTLGFRVNSNDLEIFPPIPDSAHRRILKLAGRGPRAHMSAFDGAITSSNAEEVFVVYYD